MRVTQKSNRAKGHPRFFIEVVGVRQDVSVFIGILLWHFRLFRE